MEDNFSFETDTILDVVVVRTDGYFNDFAAESVSEEFHYQLGMGQKKFVVSFLKTSVINSLAICILMDIIDIIVEENDGQITFCHLNETHKSTLEMMGLFQDAPYFETEQLAIDYIVKKK
ncbi:STAS domain-containing protein [Candidatus Riflebacteria bacterium]